MRATAITFIAAAALSACGSGSGGGLGGIVFGTDRSDPISVARDAADVPLAQQILSLDAAPTPGGVIVSVIALPPTQGFWDAGLVPVPSDDASTYVMEFRLLPPLAPSPVGTQPSREVLGGTFLTQGDLAGIDTIAVQGASNRRSIRRR